MEMCVKVSGRYLRVGKCWVGMLYPSNKCFKHTLFVCHNEAILDKYFENQLFL